MEPRVLLAFTLGFYVILRCVEGLVNRRNTRRLRAKQATAVRPDGFYAIAATQGLALASMVVEGFFWPGRGAALWPGTPALLAVAFLAILLRVWCMLTLGERWTFRVWLLPERSLVRGGPYRFLRHPNYLAVFLEYCAVPAAFALFATTAILVPLGAWSLLYRRQIEERALRPSRTEHDKTD